MDHVEDIYVYQMTPAEMEKHFREYFSAIRQKVYGMDAIEALEEGKKLVRSSRLVEGLAHLDYALNEFFEDIDNFEKNLPPELYLLVDECYLFMMSATIGFREYANIVLTYERKQFHEDHNFEKVTKNVEYPNSIESLDDLF